MKYIRKNINEGVKLPSKQQKNVTLEDIANVNLEYFKTHFFPDMLNQELNRFSELRLDLTLDNYNIPRLYNVKSENGTRDFSPSIVNIVKSSTAYTITLAVYIDDVSVDGSTRIICKDNYTPILLKACKNIISNSHGLIEHINFVFLPLPQQYSYRKFVDKVNDNDKQFISDHVQAVSKDAPIINSVEITTTEKDFRTYVPQYIEFVDLCVNERTDSVQLNIDITVNYDDINTRYNGVFSSTDMKVLYNECNKRNVSVKNIKLAANITSDMFIVNLSYLSNITNDFSEFYIECNKRDVLMYYSYLSRNSHHDMQNRVYVLLLAYLFEYGYRHRSMCNTIKYYPSTHKFYITSKSYSDKTTVKEICIDDIVDDILSEYGDENTIQNMETKEYVMVKNMHNIVRRFFE